MRPNPPISASEGNGSPHGKGVVGFCGERSGDIGRRHLDHLDLRRLDSPDLHSAEYDQALVGNQPGIATTRPRTSPKLRIGLFLNHKSAAIAVAKIHNLCRHALSFQGNSERGHDENRLHLVRDERFLDLGNTLEHARPQNFAALREFGNVVGSPDMPDGM
jgi:hypothetical protein